MPIHTMANYNRTLIIIGNFCVSKVIVIFFYLSNRIITLAYRIKHLFRVESTADQHLHFSVTKSPVNGVVVDVPTPLLRCGCK